MSNLLHVWIRKLGKTGFAGALGLLTAGLLYVLGTHPTHAKISDIKLTGQTLQKNHISKTMQQPLSPNIQLAQSNELPQLLKQIFELAADEGLHLVIGEYKYSQSQQDGLLKYEMSLPLQGRYQDIRHFLKSLATIPYLSIHNLELKRPAVSEAKVNARLQMLLYLVPRNESDVKVSSETQ